MTMQVLPATTVITGTPEDITGTANRLSVVGGTGAALQPVALNVDTGLLPSPLAADAGKILQSSGANAASWVTPWQPLTLADGAAANNTIYFSSDLNVLVYKDGGGVVNKLYDLPA